MRFIISLMFGLCLPGLWGQAPDYLISTLAGGVRVGFPAQTTSAEVRLITPAFVTADTAGNVYISDSYYDRILRVTPAGAVTTYAGSDTGFAGDGGAPAAARFNQVAGLAVGPRGELYVSDTLNSRIRRISADGVTITTFAGTGALARGGDGGQATAAGIGYPRGIAVDSAGNVYFSDVFNHVVRRVDTAGVIRTVAGSGRPGVGGDGGQATSAQLQSPGGLAIDAQSNLYIADTLNHRVRRVTTDGRIDSFAGTGISGFAGDGASARAAQLFAPNDIALSKDGDLYIADRSNSRVRRVSNGNITTLIGGGGGRQLPIAPTQFAAALPNSVAVDPAGQVLLLDDGRRQVYRVNPAAGNNLQLFAGATPLDAPGDLGPAGQATLFQPLGVAADAQGNVYISDLIDNRIRRIAANGVITTFAGTGSLGITGDGGPARLAELGRPRGLALDPKGNLYVTGVWGSYVRRIAPDGVISAFTSVVSGFAGDGGPVGAARVLIPSAIASDAAGNIYIADTGNDRIRRVTPAGIINTIAGSGPAAFSGDGGPAIQARLAAPRGVAVDARGNLYISDSGNNRIRRVDGAGVITTFAGNGELGLGGDGGPATEAQLFTPAGLVFDSAGNLLVSMAGQGQVRAISPDGVIRTIAGTPTTGFSGDGGPAVEAQLSGPVGLAQGLDGAIYVADLNNSRVRKLELARLTAGGVLNRASAAPGPVAPYELVLIRGLGLGPADTVNATPENGRLPKTLAGVQVLFDDVPAPLLSVQERLVVAAVPANLGETVRLQLDYNGRRTNAVTLSTAPAAPGILTRSEDGLGQAVARNEDGSDNSDTALAARGGLVTLTVIGAGATDLALEDGQVVAGEISRPSQPLEITIGGTIAEIVDARVPAGQTAGVIEVTVRVPATSATGAAVPVTVKAGGVPAQSGVTIAVASDN